MSHEAPHGSWQKSAANLKDWDHRRCLIIVDYFSKYPFLSQLHSISVPAVIGPLTRVFSLQGTPKSIYRQWTAFQLQRILPVLREILIQTHNIQSTLSPIQWIYRKVH